MFRQLGGVCRRDLCALCGCLSSNHSKVLFHLQSLFLSFCFCELCHTPVCAQLLMYACTQLRLQKMSLCISIIRHHCDTRFRLFIHCIHLLQWQNAWSNYTAISKQKINKLRQYFSCFPPILSKPILFSLKIYFLIECCLLLFLIFTLFYLISLSFVVPFCKIITSIIIVDVKKMFYLFLHCKCVAQGHNGNWRLKHSNRLNSVSCSST